MTSPVRVRGAIEVNEAGLAEPLVLHVIPTRVARGAQREARALADRLDLPGVRRHRVLSLAGSGDDHDMVPVDYVVDDRPEASAVGFDPRLVLRLRRVLDRLAPVLVVAHGGEPLKFLVPALFRRPCPLAYYAIGTVAAPARRPIRRSMWRFLVRRPDLVTAEGSEVLEECRTFLGVAAERLVLVPNGRDPEEFRPPADPPGRTVPVITFVGALSVQKRPDRFVDLVAELRTRGLDFRALLVGDGPLREQITPGAQAGGVELWGRATTSPRCSGRRTYSSFPVFPGGKVCREC